MGADAGYDLLFLRIVLVYRRRVHRGTRRTTKSPISAPGATGCENCSNAACVAAYPQFRRTPCCSSDLLLHATPYLTGVPSYLRRSSS